MGLNASKINFGGGFRQPNLEPGPYPGRLVKVIDLGLQPQSYQGEEKPPARKINVTYELLDEFMVDEDDNVQEDKPRWISETMPLHNLQADRAKSTQRYLALDPQQKYGGDWAQLLGTPCVVTVVNNPGSGKNADRVFDNVGTLSPMRVKDADKAPALINDPVFFDCEEPDMEVFNKLPDFIKSQITSNLEFQGSILQTTLGQTADEADTGTDATPDGAY